MPSQKRYTAPEAAKRARGPLAQAIREIDALRGAERMKLEKALEHLRSAHTALVDAASGRGENDDGNSGVSF